MTAIGTAAAVVDRLEPVPATFGAVFAVPEFRVLWLAQVLSVVGDQLARVALSVLTFHRTGSPLLTGAGYALSYLPAVAGGTSSPPRRPAVAAASSVQGAQNGPGGAAARGAPGRPVRRCQCRQQRRHPGRPALGFAAGGGLAAVLGTSATLALDAVTFGASAGLLWLGLRPRPAPPGPVTGIRSGSPLCSAAAGARLVGSDARLRALVGCAWLGYFFVVPEGLAAPYAAALGGGACTVASWSAWRCGRSPASARPTSSSPTPPSCSRCRPPAGTGPGVRARAVGHLRRAGSGHPRRRGHRPVRRARCGGRGGRRRARSRHRHHADVELPGHGGSCGSALTTVAPAQRRSAATGRRPPSITEQPDCSQAHEHAASMCGNGKGF